MAPSDSTSTPVPFPQPEGIRDPNASASRPDSPTSTRRHRTSTNASATSTSNRLRTASIKLMDADPPPGMWAATGATASKAPSLKDIRRRSFGSDGWNEETQRNRAGSRSSQEERMRVQRRSSAAVSPMEGGSEPFPAVAEKNMRAQPSSEAPRHAPPYSGKDKYDSAAVELRQTNSLQDKTSSNAAREPRTSSGQYANGYVPPPKLPWTRSFAIGLKSFWKWFLTPVGFLITLYGLNVVAWGGMLFLLLCNAAPAMCTPTCDDINSPRRIWVEIDSQILNALFCVTGFGLAPWRFRDLYWLGCWRIGGSSRKEIGIRRLAGIHRGWFRLPGSEQLPELANAATVDAEDPAVPIPVKKIPDPPPTGIRASPTKGWKMDFVVWNNVMNTVMQVMLCFYMYNYNRIDRPSWATGLFVALGMIVASIAGIMMWREGKRVKKVEGVPWRREYQDTPADVEGGSTQEIPLVSSGVKTKS